MSDLAITAASIVAGTVSGFNPIVQVTSAGEALTQGQAVYRLSSDGKLYRADANASSTAAAAVGVMMNAALTDQPAQYMSSGPLQFGGILTRGTWYVCSTTAGGICPTSDLASGSYSSLLGYAYSTMTMVVGVNATGVSFA